MAKIKASELSGPALRWAVAKAEGYIDDPYSWLYQAGSSEICDSDGWKPLSWAAGGEIAERERINMVEVSEPGRAEGGADVLIPKGWKAYKTRPAYWMTPTVYEGSTPLEAAMRCWVGTKLGPEVEIPDELLEANHG